MSRCDFTNYESFLIFRQGMNDTVEKREVRLVPPFEKGGLGGISVCHDQAKSPPPPLWERGETIMQQYHS